jgi:putative ABC transport system ATP-binding protein
VAIARALVTRPQIVLADEPTANLDSVTGQHILDLMRDLNRTQGTTFIFSTHDQKVMSYANTIVRLADGKLDSGNGVPAAAPHVSGAPA